MTVLDRVRSAAPSITLLLIPMLAFPCIGRVAAQTETGQIIVKALDPAGALVPGAAVTVRTVDRGMQLTATTNEEGLAPIPSLQPGSYDVTITGTAFAPVTRRAQVTVGGRQL